MKNNNQNEIRQGRAQKLHKAMATDILVVSKASQNTVGNQAQPQRRRRRIDYAKKIMNDPFIFQI